MPLILPYPPTMNTYWRHVGYRTLISREGRTFRRNVCALLGGGRRNPPTTGRIALAMDAFPPDRRRRDLDNLPKSVLDAIGHAGVYADDSQIDLLVIRRRDVVPGGRLLVTIEEFPLQRCPLCGGPIPDEAHDAQTQTPDPR